MNPFDHVGVLYSFIVSLGLAQVMTTVGLLVQQRQRVVFSWPYALWLLIALLSHLDFWLQLWTYRTAPSWSVADIFLLLAWAASLFMMTTLMQLGAQEDDKVDLPAFHERQRKGYIAAFAVGFVISLVADNAIDRTYTAEERLFAYVAGPILMLPWSLLAVFNARPWAQWTGALGTLAMAALSFLTMDAVGQG